MDILLIIIIILLVILFIFLNTTKKKTNSEHFTENKKIAFLFLIKDKINKEELWNRFFKNVDTSKYSIYIHYKEGAKLKYFDNYKLDTVIETAWGDVSLVKAQILLLNEALKDKNNYKFVYVSGACIPVKNFDYIYNFLTANNNCYFNTENKKNIISYINNKITFYFNNKTTHQKNKSKETFINYYKSFQWFILNRENSEIIVNDKTEIVKYEKTFAPDELYFLSTLRKNKASNIVINKNISDYTTFARWGNKTSDLFDFSDFNNNYKKFNSEYRSMPYEYIKLDDNELKYIINDTKCLFMRKILADTTINDSLLPY